jgi:hypothetical protein
MDEVTSMYEKKVDIMLSKMFGDADSQLKAVTKMSLMNNVLTEEMKQTLIQLRDQALKDAQLVNEEMTMTLDASGNVVPIKEESLSLRQRDMKVTFYDIKEESEETHS